MWRRHSFSFSVMNHSIHLVSLFLYVLHVCHLCVLIHVYTFTYIYMSEDTQVKVRGKPQISAFTLPLIWEALCCLALCIEGIWSESLLGFSGLHLASYHKRKGWHYRPILLRQLSHGFQGFEFWSLGFLQQVLCSLSHLPSPRPWCYCYWVSLTVALKL